MHLSDYSTTCFCPPQENKKVYGQGKHTIETQNVKQKLSKNHIFINCTAFASLPLRKDK